MSASVAPADLGLSLEEEVLLAGRRLVLAAMDDGPDGDGGLELQSGLRFIGGGEVWSEGFRASFGTLDRLWDDPRTLVRDDGVEIMPLDNGEPKDQWPLLCAAALGGDTHCVYLLLHPEEVKVEGTSIDFAPASTDVTTTIFYKGKLEPHLPPLHVAAGEGHAEVR
jgi:hypothetical protein